MKQKFLLLAACLLASAATQAQSFTINNNTSCTIYHRIYDNQPGVCFVNAWTPVLSIPPFTTLNYPTQASLGLGAGQYYKIIFSTNTNALTSSACPVQGQVGQNCVPFPSTYTVTVPAGCGPCGSITANWVDVSGNITVNYN